MTSEQSTYFSPCAQTMGFEVISAEAGTSAVRYRELPAYMNTFGMTHGGVLMTLLDFSMSAAASTVTEAGDAMTIEIKTMFMQAARGDVVATCKVMHHTKHSAFVMGEIHDAEGRLCTHGTGVFRLKSSQNPANAATPK